MNPNVTISYLAAQGRQQQVERDAARGWMVEQAAALGGSCKPEAAAAVKRWAAAIFAIPHRVVCAMTGVATPAGNTSPRLDRVG